MQREKNSGGDMHGGKGERLPPLSLFRLLNVLDDAVIAVNESEEIRFCNRAGENLLRHPAGELCGQLIWSIFHSRSVELLRSLMNSSGDRHAVGQEGTWPLRVSLGGRNDAPCFVNVHVATIRNECSVYSLFVLKWPGNALGLPCQRRHDGPGSVCEEVAVIRARLSALAVTLAAILPAAAVETGKVFFELSGINGALARLDLLLPASPLPGEERRLLVVEVMNLSVTYWMECSGASKFDLARDSRLWTVYTNPDGWERTQTMDKYLDVHTLPQRPNWQKVLATAAFVLSRCSTPSPLRDSLAGNWQRLYGTMGE